jgi:hypothetical protein
VTIRVLNPERINLRSIRRYDHGDAVRWVLHCDDDAEVTATVYGDAVAFIGYMPGHGDKQTTVYLPAGGNRHCEVWTDDNGATVFVYTEADPTARPAPVWALPEGGAP